MGWQSLLRSSLRVTGRTSLGRIGFAAGVHARKQLSFLYQTVFHHCSVQLKLTACLQRQCERTLKTTGQKKEDANSSAYREPHLEGEFKRLALESPSEDIVDVFFIHQSNNILRVYLLSM